MEADISVLVSVIVSAASAPTWKVTVPAVRRLIPLNSVLDVMSEISLPSCWTSAEIAFLSPASSVPLSYCTFRSRTRCSIECTSFRAPSPV